MAVVAVIILLVIIMVLGGSGAKSTSSPPNKVQMRCPSCGAPVIVRGETWECPYCADCGRCRRKG